MNFEEKLQFNLDTHIFRFPGPWWWWWWWWWCAGQSQARAGPLRPKALCDQGSPRDLCDQGTRVVLAMLAMLEEAVLPP